MNMNWDYSGTSVMYDTNCPFLGLLACGQRRFDRQLAATPPTTESLHNRDKDSFDFSSPQEQLFKLGFLNDNFLNGPIEDDISPPLFPSAASGHDRLMKPDWEYNPR
jgi:hypothetical protein